MNVKLAKQKLLLVEGRDEENFFTAALGHHSISDVQILVMNGKQNLTPTLKALMNDVAFPSVQSLAVVRDADVTAAGAQTSAASGALASVQAALVARGLACPAGHGQFATGPPRVGVFIMPDGASDGMLETLCISSVSTRPEFRCLTDYFACCHTHNVVPNNMHKARAHAWLSSQIEPDKRVGEAALAGYWPFADAAFASLWSFLQAM